MSCAWTYSLLLLLWFPLFSALLFLNGFLFVATRDRPPPPSPFIICGVYSNTYALLYNTRNYVDILSCISTAISMMKLSAIVRLWFRWITKSPPCDNGSIFFRKWCVVHFIFSVWLIGMLFHINHISCSCRTMMEWIACLFLIFDVGMCSFFLSEIMPL